MEIEPWAMKTLLLVQSNKEDAPYKLREMLVETIQQKYGGRRSFRPVPPVPSSWLAEYRAKKFNQEREELLRLKQSSPASPTPDSNMTDSTDSATENVSNDTTIELVEDGLTCAVCSEVGFNPYDLVECAECHSHYHKECHSPPISERDISDPRVVWYCRRCARTNKLNTPSVSGQGSTKQNNKLGIIKTSTHTLPSSSPIIAKHFGGSGNKKILCGKYQVSNVLTALKGHSSNLNIITADRRLQIMKKKAARKQDKRSILKQI